jgi:hypothetical protein
MRIQKKTLFLIISIFISLIFSSYFWKFIKLPYQEINIIGVYSKNQYHAANDIIRYIFFILTPVSVFLILQIYFEKFSIKKAFNQIQISQDLLDDKDLLNKLIKFLVILFIFLEFFSTDFTTTQLDLFHEGQRLSSAYKSFLDSSLWSGSYVTVGIFYETLSAKLIWQLFDHQSIGLMRFADRIYILICKILLVLIIFKISKFSNLKSFYKEFFIVFTSLILTIYLFDYHTERNDAEYLLFRELPVLLLSYLFFEIISKKNSNKFLIILIGVISLSSMLWSIDRGIVCNLLIFFILFYFLLTKQFNNVIILFTSIIFCWIVAKFLLGNEFDFFMQNTLSLLKEINYIHGVIHVTPFSSEPESMRASKIMLAVVFCLIMSLNLFFKKNDFSVQFKLAMLFLAILTFLTYGYNLGRSGGVHLKEVFGYSVIFIVVFIFYTFLNFISKKNISFLNHKKFNIIFLVIFTTILFIFSFNINFLKIVKFKDKFNEYIFLDDDYFINKKDKSFIKKVKLITKDQICIQLFTNEAGYLYLLKKPSCTKYYFVWSIGSVYMQNNLIAALKDTDIILSSKYDNKGHPTHKLPLVKSYIDENYSIFYEENATSNKRNKRIILKKNYD